MNVLVRKEEIPMNEIIRSIESAQLKANIPAFAIGDTVA